MVPSLFEPLKFYCISKVSKALLWSIRLNRIGLQCYFISGFKGTDGSVDVTAPPTGAATHICLLRASSATAQEESL